MAIDLSRVSSGKVSAPPLALVYGPEGCGKTSFCAGAPAPILLRAERGQAHLDVPRYPLDVQDGGTEIFSSFAEVLETLQAVYHEPKYQTVVLDSITAVERLIHEHVCAEDGVETLQKVGGGYGKGFDRAADHVWNLVKWSQAIQKQGRLFLFVAHAEVRPFNDPEGDDYSEYLPRMHKAAREILTSQCDHVLFMNWKTFRAKSDQGFGKSTTTATGQQRMLYTAKRPAFYAKNRYGLPAELQLPDDPGNPSAGWEAFMEAVRKAQASASVQS